VAEAGTPLVTIVPEGEDLIARALVLNKGLLDFEGFVAKGDPVILKLEAYPFT
jgi:hypothetical protein